ncbi:MAG TPA: cyclodeaminase/cyclohydrolase family protein, partial [candidate division Zixibacteria bacterium]|nr:cyclodeaminase/cyclohydrolase family protein [candidate division Zixibacteria bacterium]
EEQAQREAAVEPATKHAAEVPLTVMQKSLEVLRLAQTVAAKGNQNSITDAGVAGLMGMSAIEGAGYNVRINLTNLRDQDFARRLREQTAAIAAEGRAIAGEIRNLVEAKL